MKTLRIIGEMMSSRSFLLVAFGFGLGMQTALVVVGLIVRYTSQ